LYQLPKSDEGDWSHSAGAGWGVKDHLVGPGQSPQD
jgi:hypothetical protein